MQITIKLKGFPKIAAFFVFIAFVLFSFCYFLYRHSVYAKALHEIHTKQKSWSAFTYKFNSKDTSQNGYLLLSAFSRNNLKYGSIIIMDLKGHVIFQKETKGCVYSFRQWNIDGRTWYTYLINDSSANHIKGILGMGHVVVLDSALNEVKQIHLQAHDDVTLDKKSDLALYDILLMPGDHYYTMALFEKVADNGRKQDAFSKSMVAAPIIQEVKNGVVVWQWDATHYPEFYDNYVKENGVPDSNNVLDYMHINSMIIDPRDSNLIVSLHNINQIIKINRHTGDIMWRLGGVNSDFQLTPEQVFYGQHNATLTDSNQTLMLFDNGNTSVRSSSRVLEFKLDERNRKISSYKSFTIPERVSENMGSVQKSGDDYIICGGSANYVIIVNRATGEKKMELKMSRSSFRAYFVKDITGVKPGQK